MDNIPLSSLFITLIILLVFSAFFSGSETALLSLNRYRMNFLVKQGHKGAKKAEILLRNTDQLLSLILICNNFVNIMASAIATMIGLQLSGDVGVAAATGILTFTMLVFSEILPKTIASIYPEKVAFTASHLLFLLSKLLEPLVWLMSLIIKGLMKLLHVSDQNQTTHFSSDELRSIVDQAGKFIPSSHQKMLLSILDLEEVTVDDIMVPRTDIGGIDVEDDWKSIMRQLNHSAHRRLVVYRNSLDEQIIGILRVREAYRLMADKNEFSKEILIRATDETYFIPAGTPLNVQLLNFRNQKERFGLVIDEYGDLKGLITLEDILEEIVGEFTTSITPSIDEEVAEQSDGSIIIDGSANLRDLNKMLNWHLENDEVRTFNGWIIEHLEEIPHVGQVCEIEGLKITILDVADNMIKQARVEPLTY